MTETHCVSWSDTAKAPHTLVIRLTCLFVFAFALIGCEVEGDPLPGASVVASTPPEAPADPVDPVDPVTPEDPMDPMDPMDPVDPVDPPADPMPPPVDPDPPIDPPPPTDQMLFETTLHPLLVEPTNFCAGCHGAIQIPTFAVADPVAAYNVITTQQKVDLNNPELSRVYLRAATDRHNCGGDAECDRIAGVFLAAIQNWATQAAANVPPPTGVGTPVLSAALTLADGVDAGAARVDDAVIAMFTFSEGSGDVTSDTSGAGAPITLQIEGMEWVEGGGLRNVSGKAQASVDDSRKLFDMITPVGAYSVEAWVLAENTAQDGPARIVSYSQDTGVRNFTLGQAAIYYRMRNRSAGTGVNGTPDLEALDPQVDTSLQHIVATFDEATGRKIFINGQLSIEEDTADTLDWLDDQIFVLGNEVTNDRLWNGVFKTVAIHNKALSGAEVQQNFDAGAGNVIALRFDVAAAVGAPGYVEMQVVELDPFSYVFANPVFVSDATGVPIKNMRIAVNGNMPVAAQTFRRIDVTALQSPFVISPLAAVIPAELGADTDSFHLEFETLGAQFGLAEAIAPATPPAPTADVAEPARGVRTFSQINDTMSGLTGIDANRNAVASRYGELRDSLPATSNLLSFSASQQIAIQQLAKTYCGEIVTDAATCDAFFGQCAIDGNAKDQVAQVLYDRFVGDNIASQPDAADMTTAVVGVIDDLQCANGCNGAEAQTALQATCMSVLSSAAVTVN